MKVTVIVNFNKIFYLPWYSRMYGSSGRTLLVVVIETYTYTSDYIGDLLYTLFEIYRNFTNLLLSI